MKLEQKPDSVVQLSSLLLCVFFFSDPHFPLPAKLTKSIRATSLIDSTSVEAPTMQATVGHVDR